MIVRPDFRKVHQPTGFSYEKTEVFKLEPR